MRKPTAAALAFVALVACGREGSPAERIKGAPAAAKRAGSSKISMVMEMRFAGNGQTFLTTMKADGVSELASKTSRMRMTVSTTPSIAQLQPCEMVSRGTEVYLAIPANRRITDGKSWAKINVAKITGVDPNSFGSDPTSQLDYLKGVSENVRRIGSEDVRGTPTTHYRFAVTSDTLSEKLTGETRDRVRAQLDQLGIKSFPLDVWIDRDDLPRRVLFRWKAAKDQVNFDISMTMEMFDYGSPVDVGIPDPAQVREESQPQNAFLSCFGGPAVPTGAT